MLVVVGDYDLVFCTRRPARPPAASPAEPSFYPVDACAEAVAIPVSGHDLNLHYTAPLVYLTVLGWMDSRVGPGQRAAAGACRL